MEPEDSVREVKVSMGRIKEEESDRRKEDSGISLCWRRLLWVGNKSRVIRRWGPRAEETIACTTEDIIGGDDICVEKGVCGVLLKGFEPYDKTWTS